MPHLVILYTPALDALCDLTALCRALADTMRTLRDGDGQAVFPPGGVRVLAYPAAHHAVADGGADAPGGTEPQFVYLNLRIGRGRAASVQQLAGERIAACARDFFAPLLAHTPIGITLQIDEGPEVFSARLGNLHARFGDPGGAQTDPPRQAGATTS